MSFGENIAYYRKQLKITQEKLAEKLDVSRQTVSRWESDSTFPDVETLIKLCDIFKCDMDTLVRGDAAYSLKKNIHDDSTEYGDIQKYDKHMNSFALLIALGVWLIIFGIALMLLISVNPVGELWGTVIFLFFIAISTADFIIMGINHTSFMKENPCMPSYPEAETKRFAKRISIAYSIATSLIFIDIIMLILSHYKDGYTPSGFTLTFWEHFTVSLFMFFISVSVFIYVYGGIQHSKYDVKQYNEECIEEGFAKSCETKSKNKQKSVSDAICSAIMLCATATFLLCGFLGNLWHPAWVAFPIGGIFCGICSVITDAIFK